MKKNYFLTFFTIVCISLFSFAQTPIITAIVDGDCSGGNPKLLEIYAKGTVDFTQYTLQNQINAGTTWGNAQDLSALGTKTDTFVYITTTGSATAISSDFPGLSSATILNSNVINLNGDDRIRIIKTSDSTVIDQFGVTDVQGTNQSWEYTDSYAKRKNGTGPDAGFVEANWTFGGKSFLDTKGVCQGGADTFQTLIGGIGTYTPTASSTPSISTVGTVSGLSYFAGNGPSNEGSFTASGINLTANITVTAPTNFEVSLSQGSGFANSVTISQSGGTANATTVYVRMIAGLSANSYSGDITLTSTGATNKTVAVSGTVNPADPQFSFTAFLNAFNYVHSVGGPSAEQSFTVEGLFLNGDIVVTAPTNFEVSLTTGANFANAVNVSPSNGTVAQTTVYVRLKASLAVGAYSGDIVLSSTGLANKTIAVTGNVYGAVTSNLIITGIVDGPLSGGVPKAIEIYVKNNIADLSLFGVSIAANGDPSNGAPRFTFPAGTATAGSFIYVASESTGFTNFFGFAPNYTTGQLNINGDDAMELYESGQLIDVFGVVGTDGTGEAWEYLDGWAYRNSNTGPSTTFNLSDWTFSGIDALDNQTTNDSATTKFPIGTYSNTTASVKNNMINGFAIYPNPVKDGLLTLTSNSADKKQVEIFNIIGKKVFAQSVTGTKSTLHLETIKTGIYIVKVTEGNAIATQKLVIR